MEKQNRELTKIAREAQRFTLSILKSTDLGSSEYECVHCIRHNPGIGQEKLCAALGMDKAAVTRQVQNLEKKGYITRTPDPRDRRAKCLYATEKAQEVKESKTAIEAYFYDWLFADLEQAERQAFLATLHKLYWKSKNQRRTQFKELQAAYEAASAVSLQGTLQNTMCEKEGCCDENSLISAR